jgi:hypothetical protein
VGIVLVIVGAFLWFYPIISTVQNYTSNSSYTRIVVVQGQVESYNQSDNRYVFGYTVTNQSSFFVMTAELTLQQFPITVGAIYTAFGLEMKVTEVHSDYFVLLVKPLY